MQMPFRSFSRIALACASLVGALSASSVGAATPMVAVSNYNAAALKVDGTLWVWGGNYDGQLGNGTIGGVSSVPVQVSALQPSWVKIGGTSSVPLYIRAEVTSVALGEGHVVALRSDGTVWTWGSNGRGQLGLGNTATTSTPTRVPGLSGVAAISAAGKLSAALKWDGTVWTWGQNRNGELGNGTSTDSSVPVQVTGLSGVKAISVGSVYDISNGFFKDYAPFGFMLALRNDGTVWGWGRNAEQQLGQATCSVCFKPVQISGLSGIAAISAGNNFGMARGSDSSVWAWGNNGWGQLGNGSTGGGIATPVRSATTGQIASIRAGGFSALMLTPTFTPLSRGPSVGTVTLGGNILAFGCNTNGQLGFNPSTVPYSMIPLQVPGIGGVIDADVSEYGGIALKANGTIFTWGIGGLLGNGATAPSYTPVQVPGF